MIKTLVFLILIPFVLSLVLRPLFQKTIKKIEKTFSAITIILITILIMGLISGGSAQIMENPIKAIRSTIAALILGIILSASGWFLFFFLDKKKRIGLAVSNLYMNIGLAAVIAFSFFSPDVILFVLVYELPANLFPPLLEKIFKQV